MGTELHALGSPGVEVGLHVDGTRAALVLANRPVLVEGLGAVDGGLVDTLGLGDLVRGAVRGNGALDCGVGGGVVGAEVLNNVVLDQRVAGPAVDGEIGIALGFVGTRVGDGAIVGQFLHPSKVVTETNRAAPGFQPFPPTRLPPVFHVTL